jgi:hypothetical protein
MTSRTVRVTVRGSFDQLTDAQRADLSAVAAEHDFLFTRYTAEGHLAYDLAARPFFTFRFAVEAADDAQAAAAAGKAQALAGDWLAAHGYGFTNLSARSVDPAEVPLGKRGRREQARKDGF